jgi:hypothetical protein
VSAAPKLGELDVFPSSWNPSIVAGGSEEEEFEVKNTALREYKLGIGWVTPEPLRDVTVSIISGPGWLTFATPVGWEEIPPQDSRKFILKASPPEDINGTFPYKIRVNCTSGFPSYIDIEGKITVRVPKSLLEIEKIYIEKVKKAEEALAEDELMGELAKIEEEKKRLIETFAKKMGELELRKVTIIKKLKISKSDVYLDEAKVPARPVEIDVEGREIRIEPSPEGLTLVEGGVKARGDVELEYENKTLIAAKSRKAIRLLPSQVKGKVAGRLKEIEIQDKEIPKYIAKVEEKGKLLWFIPVKVKMDYEINAETGKVVKVKKPWWSFLVKIELIPVSSPTHTKGEAMIHHSTTQPRLWATVALWTAILPLLVCMA